MKKILLLASLLAIIAYKSDAQKAANAPRVLLGKLTGATMVNGKWTNTDITRQELLTNNILIVEGSTCKVTGYTFSILQKGHDFQGPYTVTNSAEFTPQIKKILAELDTVGGRVFIENIKLNCEGVERIAPSIVFKYK